MDRGGQTPIPKKQEDISCSSDSPPRFAELHVMNSTHYEIGPSFGLHIEIGGGGRELITAQDASKILP